MHAIHASRKVRSLVAGILLATWICDSAFLYNPPCYAQVTTPAVPAAPGVRAAGVVQQDALSPGTRLMLHLDQQIESGREPAGTPLRFVVDQEVRSADGQRVLVPAGSIGTGHIVTSQRRRTFGRPGKLEITCDTVTLPDGRTIPVHLVAKSSAAGKTGTNEKMNPGAVRGQSSETGVIIAALLFMTPAVIAFSSFRSHSVGADLSGIGDAVAPLYFGTILTAAGLLLTLITGGSILGKNVQLERGRPFVAQTE